jgi:hypothetical protein
MQFPDGLNLRGQGRAENFWENGHAVLGTLATPNPNFAAIDVELLDPEGHALHEPHAAAIK